MNYLPRTAIVFLAGCWSVLANPQRNSLRGLAGERIIIGLSISETPRRLWLVLLIAEVEARRIRRIGKQFINVGLSRIMRFFGFSIVGGKWALNMDPASSHLNYVPNCLYNLTH